MKLSIQINPLETISENELRSLPMVVANVARTHGARKALGVAQGIAGRVRKQRVYVRKILDSQLPRLKRTLPGRAELRESTNTDRVTPNFYRVTLIRISAGTLDEGSVASALKAVQDEVAAWLGIDDGPRAPASWRYGQQRGPQKTYAVRIEIEDDDPTPGELRKAVGQPIPQLGPIVGDVQHAPRTLMGMLNAAYQRETAEPQNDGRPQAKPGGVLRVGHGLSRPGESSVSRVLDEAVARAGEAHRQERREGAVRPNHGQLDAHLLDNPGDRMHARAPSIVRRAAERMVERGAAPRGCTVALVQAPLIFRRAYAIIPEKQDDASDEWLLTAITPPLDHDGAPPIRINLAGRVFVRRLDSNPALGEHWIYEVAPSAAPAQESRATR